jgi:hypothetical protein
MKAEGIRKRSLELVSGVDDGRGGVSPRCKRLFAEAAIDSKSGSTANSNLRQQRKALLKENALCNNRVFL